MLKAIEPTPTPSSAEWLSMPGPQALDAWPRVRELFRTALESHDGSYDEYDMAAFVFSGQWQLWTWPDRADPRALCITEIIQYPKFRTLAVRFIVGEWAAFGDNLHVMEAYARASGCETIEAAMRQGLTRRLPPDWKARNVNMVKRLD